MVEAQEVKFSMPARDGLVVSLVGGGTILLYQQDHANGDEAYISLDQEQARTLITWLEALLAEIGSGAGEEA